MKTSSVSLLLGVCLLLLSALTVSAVSLDVSPNHQQFFSGPSKVFLSCVDDGQTVDGWTVKRTKEGRSTEDCEAAADFERVNRSFCLLIPDSSFTAVLWCENSGQRTDNVSISVSDTGLILDIPALPVMTGSDVTLRCRQKNGDAITANFSINGRHVGPQSELNISKVQTSHEGLYACSTDEATKSPESRLRVRAPPPPPSTPSSPPVNSTVSTPSSPPTDSSLPPPSSSSLLVPAVSGLVCVVLLVLVLVLVVILCRKLKAGPGADPVSVRFCGGDTMKEPSEMCYRVKWSFCLCFSGLFLLTAAGVCVLLLSAFTLSAVSQRALGVDVLLSCQFPAPVSQDDAVVWRRDDLSPQIVHSLLKGEAVLGSQNPRYLDRTSMRADALQTGDLSLTLRNPTFSDSGTYTCTTRRFGQDKDKTEVQLLVKEPPPPPPLWHTVLPAVLGTMLIMAVIVSVCMWLKNKRMKSLKASKIKPAEVTEGAKEVQLSVTTPAALPEKFIVTWSRIQPEYNKVCVRKVGWEPPDNQDDNYKPDEIYQGCTEMKTQQANGKRQLTLTLKSPLCKHGGVYWCIIYDEQGEILEGTAVSLWVKETWGTTIRRALSGHPENERPRTVPLVHLKRLLSENYAHVISGITEEPATSENNETSPLKTDPGV